MSKKELQEEIQSTKNGIACALLEGSLNYGNRKDPALNPFMYAGCMVAAAVSAWVRMMIAIRVSNGESVKQEEIEPMLRELLDAAIKDTMRNIDIIQENLKTK